MSNRIKVEIPKTELNEFLSDYTDIVHKASQAALRKGIRLLKDAALRGLNSSGINIGRNPKYSDTLREGIRTTGIRDDDSIYVHILGSRAKTSGTFRLRFFESGTKERYAKTYKGEPLKKKRYLGKIPQGKYSFFESSVTAAQSSAISVFNEQLNKYIENAWNNGQHNTSR